MQTKSIGCVAAYVFASIEASLLSRHVIRLAFICHASKTLNYHVYWAVTARDEVMPYPVSLHRMIKVLISTLGVH